jgi:hypothetical protein
MAFKSMEYKRSKADPCLYYAWTAFLGLVLWRLWVNDCLTVGNKEAVKQAKQQMMNHFDCDEIGELKEYVGHKVDINKEERAVIMLMQLVLLQIFEDEFKLPEGTHPRMSVIAGDVLVRGEEKHQVQIKEQKRYCSGVGQLPHMMCWSRPETLNAVRELSRFMQGAMGVHVKVMHRVMKYSVGTPNRGMYLKPNTVWDGSPDFKFMINGRSDSDNAKDMERRCSVSIY